MSAGAPWSVKGIDPRAREVAKDLARRSGMTLGEWLNRVILEDDLPDEITTEEDFAGRPRRGSHGGVIDYGRLRAAAIVDGSDAGRIAAALDRVTDRIEASETRTGLAISGAEHSIRLALARIDAAEREQTAAASRLDATMGDAAAEQARLAERIRRLESEPIGPRSHEALSALEARLVSQPPEQLVESVVQRLGDRLAKAEGRTTQALENLKGALIALDGRLATVEQSTLPGEGSFEALAQNLSRQVEAVRAELAQQLAASGTGEVEARLAAMDSHVQAAERRSTQAVEQIGRQVLSMAEAVSRKLGEVDQRSAEAIDQVGSEVARIASAVELRLARGEHAQTEAFERLGAELAAVTARLSGEPVAVESTPVPAEEEPRYRVVPEIQPDLASEVAVAASESALPPPPEPEPESALVLTRHHTAEALADEETFVAPFGPELMARVERETDDPWLAGPAPGPSPEPEARAEMEADARPADVEEDIFEVESRVLPEGAPPPLSTRDVIEQARASARAARGQTGAGVRARASGKASGRFFKGFGARQSKPNSTLQTALMVAGGAAFLSVGAAGLTLMQQPRGNLESAALSPFTGAPRAAVALSPRVTESAATVDFAAEFPRVQADVAAGRLAGVDRLKVMAGAGYAPAQLYMAQLYEGGEAGVAQDMAEARRLTALAAESGDPKAMHNLGVYYFRGDGGSQDLASAAQWFRKAADVGVVESQYNLGLLYQSGSGVTKDLAEARRWFDRAAAAGDVEATQALAGLPAPAGMEVRDAQRILARLGYYEGAADGRDTPAFKTALSAYQRKQGRHATGTLDPTTVAALSVYRR